jgi:hypothetical protein
MTPRVPVDMMLPGNDKNLKQDLSLNIVVKMSVPTATFFAVNPPAAPSWVTKSLTDLIFDSEISETGLGFLLIPLFLLALERLAVVFLGMLSLLMDMSIWYFKVIVGNY